MVSKFVTAFTVVGTQAEVCATVKYMHAAHRIIVLDSGRIQYQGALSDITKQGYEVLVESAAVQHVTGAASRELSSDVPAEDNTKEESGEAALTKESLGPNPYRFYTRMVGRFTVAVSMVCHSKFDSRQVLTALSVRDHDVCRYEAWDTGIFYTHCRLIYIDTLALPGVFFTMGGQQRRAFWGMGRWICWALPRGGHHPVWRISSMLWMFSSRSIHSAVQFRQFAVLLA